jgi:hypothetical protein
MCNRLNLKILIHIFTIIYLIMIAIIMRGENFVVHLDGLGGTPVCRGTPVAHHCCSGSRCRSVRVRSHRSRPDQSHRQKLQSTPIKTTQYKLLLDFCKHGRVLLACLTVDWTTGVRSPAGENIFQPLRSDRLWGPPSLPTSVYRGSLPRG